ncbi:MAG: helix-turn-helix domain-containing protein [Clostridia bacterium]|nr:helix-turn-helix domain-containing protein [Clostridia bacterium]
MLGEKIKQLRNEKCLTQKELADQLFVTAQAVSRWENDEVEPSLSTLSQMSQIFDVTVDELINGHSKNEASPPAPAPAPQVIIEKEIVYQQDKPVLAVCEKCNKPIYDGSQIVREYDHVYCATCNTNMRKEAFARKVAYGEQQRTKSFVWSSIWTAIILIACIFTVVTNPANELSFKICSIVTALLFFPFFSCLYLKNNFVGDMFCAILEWGFVKFPTIIFSLDLEGIVWLLTVKLIFWILGILLAIAMGILALVISLIVSPFVYPFALVHNFQHPEDTDIKK